MQVTAEGLELIKAFEGFRPRAYRCPAGVWTVGYGHTSMAGPPDVTAATEVTKAEAAAILRRDVERFAGGVRQAVTRPLTGPQFSALVSFAYNVGLGNFRSSSVLKAVNAGDLAAVPRRLQLWNKAGGKALPGLTRRRAAEAAMFLGGGSGEPDMPSPGTVQPDIGKPATRSTTVWAAVLSLLAGGLPLALQSLGRHLAWPLLAGALLILLAAAVWIVRERLRKSTEEGI